MVSNWNRLAIEIAESDGAVDAEPITSSEDESTGLDIDPASYIGGTRNTIIKARIGQNFFRKSVLSAYQYKCCISGLTISELLIASHIVPWRDAPENRLNPRNGLCLSAIHDRAFDLGLITISERLQVVLSTKLKKAVQSRYIQDTFVRYEGCEIQQPDKFSPHLDFLKHHRDFTFIG